MNLYILQNEDGTKDEYRVWNPFRSKLAAAILGGVDNIWIVSSFIYFFNNMCCALAVCFKFCILTCVFSFSALLCPTKKPGARVLYLGAASGTTVSHVSDIVGPVSANLNLHIL